MTTTMSFRTVLSIAALALSRPTWASEPATTTSSSEPNVLLDAQLGPYPVSIYDHEIETLRPDPLAPAPQLRRLMVTVYRPFLDNFACPLEHQSHIPYAPPVVAAALLNLLPLDISLPNASSILAPVQLINCSRPILSSSSSGPLLLFSPGLGGTHHVYASTLLAAASSGYTVIAIDHTHEAAAVVFPDGSVAFANASVIENSTPSNLNYLQAIRDADVVSVLDTIERGDVPSLGRHSDPSSGANLTSTSTFPSSSSATLRTVMYGHSLGGSTAANAAFSDPRVLAAANMDGTFWGPVANATVRKPLLMIGSTLLHGQWRTFYTAHVRGWKTWVYPDNTVHYGYTDLPILVDLLGLRGTVVPLDLTGTIDSHRLQQVVWRYTLQFFADVLKGAEPDLLDGRSAEFPDVEFVGHAEAETGP